MEKLKNLVNPGSKKDDEVMYGSGLSDDPVHSGSTGTRSGQGSFLLSIIFLEQAVDTNLQVLTLAAAEPMPMTLFPPPHIPPLAILDLTASLATILFPRPPIQLAIASTLPTLLAVKDKVLTNPTHHVCQADSMTMLQLLHLYVQAFLATQPTLDQI